MTPDKIVEQIKKLLALADTSRGATIEEAAAAAAKAQALLFKHNLTMAQVQESEAGQDDDGYVLGTSELGANHHWRALLMHAIAENNFCRAVRLMGTSWCHLVGKPHNVEVAQYLYRYLSREVLSGWTSRRKQFRKRSRSRYCEGCVAAIAWALEQRRREDEAAGDDCRALVLREQHGLDAARDRLVGKTAKGKKKRIRRSKAFEAGVIDGSQIEIRDGVTAQPAAPQLEDAC